MVRSKSKSRPQFLQPINVLDRGRRKLPQGQTTRLQTKRGCSIIAHFIEYEPPPSLGPSPFASSTRVPTILFSHGTSVDLGSMLPFWSEVAKDLKCSLLAYDYTGYGQSSGKPSVADTLADIEACYKHLLAQGIPSSNIVLYGLSLGSGPTVDLAARTHGLGGVILHAPLASGMRALRPSVNYWPSWLDIYPNTELVPKISAPLLLIHGTEDQVINIEAAKVLHSLAKRPVAPLWAKGCTHDNVELSAAYIPHVRSFLQGLFGHEYSQ